MALLIKIINELNRQNQDHIGGQHALIFQPETNSVSMHSPAIRRVLFVASALPSPTQGKVHATHSQNEYG